MKILWRCGCYILSPNRIVLVGSLQSPEKAILWALSTYLGKELGIKEDKLPYNNYKIGFIVYTKK